MAGRSGWKWSNLIGSLSGRNPAVLTGLPDRFVSKLKTIFYRHYNKHLIDQACSVRIGVYWSRTFLRIYTNTKSTQPISPYPDLTLGQ
jgi:hypothetical protein